MSHVKNVQAFEQLKGFCTGYGGQYNPGKQNLQVNALTTLLNNAQQVLAEVNDALTDYERVTNTREVVFNDVGKLATRMYYALKSSGAHPLTIEDARSSIRKISGGRASKRKSQPEAKAGEEKIPIQVARGTDYATLAFTFAKLVETIAAEDKYSPNETELSLPALQQKRIELQQWNAAVIEAAVQLNIARTKRNILLYTGENNLVDTAMATKSYVRSLFGYRSEQFSGASKLQFTKPKA